jgi:hypothetical protein
MVHPIKLFEELDLLLTTKTILSEDDLLSISRKVEELRKLHWQDKNAKTLKELAPRIK